MLIGAFCNLVENTIFLQSRAFIYEWCRSIVTIETSPAGIMDAAAGIVVMTVGIFSRQYEAHCLYELWSAPQPILPFWPQHHHSSFLAILLLYHCSSNKCRHSRGLQQSMWLKSPIAASIVTPPTDVTVFIPPAFGQSPAEISPCNHPLHIARLLSTSQYHWLL